MTDTTSNGQIDSVPIDLTFEREVTESVAFYKATPVAENGFLGPQRTDFLRVCVRTALKSAGSAAPEHLARAARILTDRATYVPDEIAESVLHEIEYLYERDSQRHRYERPPLEGFPIFQPMIHPPHDTRNRTRPPAPRDRLASEHHRRD